jgi:hypothetical protein
MIAQFVAILNLFENNLSNLGFLKKKISDREFQFHNKDDWYFIFYIERYDNDGYFFDLCDKKTKKNYAVWILFDICGETSTPNPENLIRFIINNYDKIKQNFDQIKIKYDLYNNI